MHWHSHAWLARNGESSALPILHNKSLLPGQCMGSDKRQGSECRWSLPERGIQELMWPSCKSGDGPFHSTLGNLQSPSRLGDCPFHMALGLWVWSSFQRTAEQREGRSVESLPRAPLAGMSLFSFLSLALLLFL